MYRAYLFAVLFLITFYLSLLLTNQIKIKYTNNKAIMTIRYHTIESRVDEDETQSTEVIA